MFVMFMRCPTSFQINYVFSVGGVARYRGKDEENNINVEMSGWIVLFM